LLKVITILYGVLMKGTFGASIQNGSDLKGRHSYATVVFNDKIWFLGGFTSNNGQDNDVWTAEK
jgi:hypothetical protein